MIYVLPVAVFLVLWIAFYAVKTRRFVLADMWAAIRLIRKHRR